MSTHNEQREIEVILSELKREGGGNEVQAFFIVKFSRLVGKVLTNVEIAMPSESRQYTMLKRALNKVLYDNSRNDLLLYFDGDQSEMDVEAGLERVHGVFARMQDELDSTLDMAFPVGPQHKAVKDAVKSSVDETLKDVTDEFLLG